MWLSFLAYHGATLAAWLVDLTLELPAWIVPVVSILNIVAVVWVLPNVIRQASVQVLSSSMHYYGDVESTVQQTQVLSKWYWLPLQLFACNFGNSHATHHFFRSPAVLPARTGAPRCTRGHAQPRRALR